MATKCGGEETLRDMYCDREEIISGEMTSERRVRYIKISKIRVLEIPRINMDSVKDRYEVAQEERKDFGQNF